MNRYSPLLASAKRRLAIGEPGTALIVAPPGEAPLVGEALAEEFAKAERRVLDEALFTSRVPINIAVGLPADQDSAIRVLQSLNGRRNRIVAEHRLLVLILDSEEVLLFEKHAPNISAAPLFMERVAFVPGPAVDPGRARQDLHRWYEARIGRLDLRGFARSEQEDVSFRVEEVYQELRAVGLASATAPAEPMLRAVRGEPVVEWLTDFRKLNKSDLFVILGHPGAGKSFFLRWLALRASESTELLGIHEPWPVLVSFSGYAQAPGRPRLIDYMIDQLLRERQAAAHVLPSAMADRRAVFLLDGLDEVAGNDIRDRFVEAVAELRSAAPGCLICVTSRVVGYDYIQGADHLLLKPFDPDAVTSFLENWCELYECSLHGDTPADRRRGHDEGTDLARVVLRNPRLRPLAETPLILTVLAMIHRSGLRLPDHRVELYEHVTHILVERWNRVRSLSGKTAAAQPIRTADAVRLLGPVALSVIESGTQGAIREDTLRAFFARSLERGPIASLGSADDVLKLFRDSLGLIVERGPGQFAFLHLTLAEYLAARELLRTGKIEAIVSSYDEVFEPRWTEVILLAAGELGLIRAEDRRLSAIVERIVVAADARAQSDDHRTPKLLEQLLADDVGLGTQDIDRIAQALIPAWWFNAASLGRDPNAPPGRRVWEESYTIARLQDTPRFEPIRSQFIKTLSEQRFWDASALQRKEWRLDLRTIVRFMRGLEADYGELVLRAWDEAGPRERISEYATTVTSQGLVTALRFPLSLALEHSMRNGRAIDFSLGFMNWRGANLDAFKEAVNGRQPELAGKFDRAAWDARFTLPAPVEASLVEGAVFLINMAPRAA